MSEDVPTTLHIVEYNVENASGRRGTFMVEYKTWAVNVTSIWSFLAGRKVGKIDKVLAGSTGAAAFGHQHALKGGALTTRGQGLWLRYNAAQTLLSRVAFTIAKDLVPIFGPGFPDLCLRPGALGYGSLTLKPIASKSRTAARRRCLPKATSAPSPADKKKRKKSEPRVTLVFPSGSYAWMHNSRNPEHPVRYRFEDALVRGLVRDAYEVDAREQRGYGRVRDGQFHFFFEEDGSPADPNTWPLESRWAASPSSSSRPSCASTPIPFRRETPQRSTGSQPLKVEEADPCFLTAQAELQAPLVHLSPAMLQLHAGPSTSTRGVPSVFGPPPMTLEEALPPTPGMPISSTAVAFGPAPSDLPLGPAGGPGLAFDCHAFPAVGWDAFRPADINHRIVPSSASAVDRTYLRALLPHDMDAEAEAAFRFLSGQQRHFTPEPSAGHARHRVPVGLEDAFGTPADGGLPTRWFTPPP